ncbi:MAG: hypothetical protein HY900_38060 [Deltaproteobacteria bacterium]|nr:hypothetical protein [Deltaproteobacteria bacterium]
MRYTQRWLSLWCAIALLVAGCGDGGGGSGRFDDGKLGANNSVSFSVRSANGGALDAPVQAVTLSATLPEGTTVATVPGSNTIAPEALTAGGGLTSPSKTVSGSVTGRVVNIAVATPEEPAIPAGGDLEIAELKVNAPGTAPFDSANVPCTISQAVGFSTVTRSTVDLTANLLPTVRVKAVQ